MFSFGTPMLGQPLGVEGYLLHTYHSTAKVNTQAGSVWEGTKGSGIELWQPMATNR